MRHTTFLAAAALSALGVVLVGLVLCPEAANSQTGERAVLLASLTPVDGGISGHRELIGGVVFDMAYRIGYQNAIYDLGQKYDLLEGMVGMMQDSGESGGILTVIGDGDVLAQFSLRTRDKARFVTCPLRKCRTLELRVDRDWSPILLVDMHLIQGRTEPKKPTDLFYTPGQPEYIPAGWYKLSPR